MGVLGGLILKPTADDSFKYTNSVSALETITFPATGTNNFILDPGDGTTPFLVTTPNPTHQYIDAGNYQASFDGEMSRFGFNDTGNKLNVTSFDAWGDVGLEELAGGFAGCVNMGGTIPIIGIENLTAVTTVNNLFGTCTNLLGPIPSNFLDTATLLLNVTGCFIDCTSLTGSIPSTFLDNSNLIILASNLFRGTGITGSIPGTFLDNATLLTNVGTMFLNCSGLTGSIPSTFLDNATLLTSVAIMFRNCSGLTGSIPSTFLDNATLVTDLINMFRSCTSLSGDAKDYWNNVQYTAFSNCYTGDNQLDNFASIPNNWKGL